MVKVDTERYEARWNETIPADIAISSGFNYLATEKSEDEARVGREEEVEFRPYGIASIVVSTTSNLNWSKVLLEKRETRESEITVTCWSTICPSFVHYNPQNYTIWTLADETFGRPVNGTYIYYVRKTKNAKSNFEFQTAYTLTIKMSNAEVNKGSKAINIDMPFDLWYEFNKHNLPFYTPPPPPQAEEQDI